ncbi:ABC transporter substrate-binding protein [Saccharothrix texasensis]|uniref:Carbohydrate ABC transporter substrate-binding protein (CUT1 family) n=1 Tax=Saccharothrix texasensis TaxID=103734 RepID=A0A3N1H2T8_9PSEU|nr:extracellular solute-binding protein [Saccharothrix texasensis]ROP36726.1 carbohydrate ABC transporter substrate-binding protein (CUT1 family) [Saccharothrix texasensis]
MRGRALLLAAILFAAGACNAEQTETPDQVTLTWWDYLNHSPMANQAVDSLLARYRQEHPDVRIERTSLPHPEFRAKLAEATASGVFPDIAAVDSTDLPRLAEGNALADLTDRFERWDLADGFLPAVRESVTHHGRVHGVPLRSTTTALVYNRDHFAAAGLTQPPTTWDGLRTAAKALTTADRSGLCFGGKGDDLTVTFLPVLWQAGGDVDRLGDQASLDALAHLDGLVNTDRSTPADVLGWTDADARQRFAEGRCAMAITGPAAVPELNQAGLDWTSAPLPQGAAGGAGPLGGETWVIGRNGRVDRAWDVLTWLAEQPDNVTEFGGGLGALPNRADTVDALAWQWDPSVAGFTEQLRSARTRTAHGARYPEVSRALSAMATRVLTGERPPDQATAEAKAEIDRLPR